MNDGPGAFLQRLFTDSRVLAPPLCEFTAADRRELCETLREFEPSYRLELPGTPPAFMDGVAGWAAECWLRACQLLVYRDWSAEAVAGELGQPLPMAGDPAVHAYNVDLTWRFLPDLLRLASGLSNDDPLVTQLRRWAMEWPLSSVGVPNLSSVNVAGFIDDACLRRLYVDRILARRDRSRLDDDRVAEAVREALGAFPELAPEFAEK